MAIKGFHVSLQHNHPDTLATGQDCLMLLQSELHKMKSAKVPQTHKQCHGVLAPEAELAALTLLSLLAYIL